ncbi:MAG: 2Fe-2S iron-sulfur cluster-binding protein, partial [Acidimicrobiia bacterium]|nr:2Fe-2S iron-sulfur cluster-binding protein [Acidimicrobiia bacterium]
MEVTFTVNGRLRTIEVEARTTLLEAIRESLLLTGTKEACGVGECGNCMVLMDGEPTPTCLVLAPDARGRDIVTIEGLAADGTLDVVQAAFLAAGAFQCGFCTPGMVVTAKALLRDRPEADPEEIKA